MDEERRDQEDHDDLDGEVDQIEGRGVEETLFEAHAGRGASTGARRSGFDDKP
jgi:hypothetical protein